jgi:transposase
MAFRSFDRKQLDLLGYSIDDLVPKEAKCRFVVELVSSLDLSKLYTRYSLIGAQAFEPSSMLATWFLAYSESVTSTRMLEDRCRRDAFYMFTCGNQKPDHSTLSRFRQDNIDLLAEYFVQILELARSKGISNFKTIAVDGTKIQAVASPSQSLTTDELERRLKAVRRDVREYMKRCDGHDLLESAGEQDNDIDSIRTKLRKLKKLESTLTLRRRELKERQKKLKKEHQASHRITVTETEAPSMRHGNGKSKAPAYNAQLSVDTETQMIVATDVVTERNDFQQFALQLQGIEKNLGADETRKYVADSGYHSLEQLDYIEQKEIDALINDPTPENRSIKQNSGNTEQLLKTGRPLHREDFYYDSKNDYYLCPERQKLHFSGNVKSHGRRKRDYRAIPEVCRACQLYALCLPKPTKFGARKILRDEQEHLAETMLLRSFTKEAKHLTRLRASTVEPAFGNIKANMGLRRFRLRGLDNVKGEFNLMAIAHNINKLYRMLDYLSDFFSFTKVQVIQNISGFGYGEFGPQPRSA